jgi:hypothetical protein
MFDGAPLGHVDNSRNRSHLLEEPASSDAILSQLTPAHLPSTPAPHTCPASGAALGAERRWV